KVGKIPTALIASFGLFEDLIGLEVHKSPTHCAMAENTLEMSDAAASAKPLLRVESNDGVASFPHTVQAWRAAEPDTCSERPDPHDFPQSVGGRGDADRHCVGVIQNQYRDGRKSRRQRGTQVQSFQAVDVRCFFDYAFANDTRHTDANC